MARTLVALIASLCIAFSAAAAQTKSETKKKAPRPTWSELTPAQQRILAPLEPEWEQLDTTRRNKWVSIADRYPMMKPAQQERLQTRMQEWAKLTPEERRAARERYRSLRQQPPQKREEVKRRWEEYEQARAAPAVAPPASSLAPQTPPESAASTPE
jgi:hypothetical protein